MNHINTPASCILRTCCIRASRDLGLTIWSKRPLKRSSCCFSCSRLCRLDDCFSSVWYFWRNDFCSIILILQGLPKKVRSKLLFRDLKGENLCLVWFRGGINRWSYNWSNIDHLIWNIPPWFFFLVNFDIGRLVAFSRRTPVSSRFLRQLRQSGHFFHCWKLFFLFFFFANFVAPPGALNNDCHRVDCPTTLVCGYSMKVNFGQVNFWWI